MKDMLLLFKWATSSEFFFILLCVRAATVGNFLDFETPHRSGDKSRRPLPVKTVKRTSNSPTSRKKNKNPRAGSLTRQCSQVWRSPSFSQIGLFANLEGVSKSTWENLEEKMHDTVTELLDQNINQNLEGLRVKKPDGVDIIIDCRWSSRGNSAEEATVTAWVNMAKLLGNVMSWGRKRPKAIIEPIQGSSK